MNARDKIKPKSIRLAILLALADGAITTIDDLQTTIDEPRKRVAGAIYPAVDDGLITRMRDDVTNGPAYKINASGREYLAKYSGAVDEPAAAGVPCASMWQESKAVAPGFLETPIPGFQAEDVSQKDAEIARLTSALDEAKASLELSGLARAVVHAGYVIQRPAKPLVRVTKMDKAQVRALSFARGGQRAQVFALVAVGAAVPGAQWRPQ